MSCIDEVIWQLNFKQIKHRGQTAYQPLIPCSKINVLQQRIIEALWQHFSSLLT